MLKRASQELATQLQIDNVKMEVFQVSPSHIWRRVRQNNTLQSNLVSMTTLLSLCFMQKKPIVLKFSMHEHVGLLVTMNGTAAVGVNLHRQSKTPCLQKMLHMWWHKLRTNPCKSSEGDCAILYQWLVQTLLRTKYKMRRTKHNTFRHNKHAFYAYTNKRDQPTNHKIFQS